MATSVPSSFDSQPSRNGSEGQPAFPPAPGCFGLIGGLGPPSTVHYYQALLGAHAVSNGFESWLIRSLGAGWCHAAWTRRALSRSSFARP